jgi:hypothetical protein
MHSRNIIDQPTQNPDKKVGIICTECNLAELVGTIGGTDGIIYVHFRLCVVFAVVVVG